MRSGRPTLVAVLGALAIALVLLVAEAGTSGATRQQQQGQQRHDAAAQAKAWTPRRGQPLSEPVQLHSRHGVLKVDLRAARGVIEVSGSRIEAQPFNGQIVGPTLHVRPGDTIEATIHNATDEDTNIHYHGLHVDPTGISDNVFRTFKPGQTVRSVVHLPLDHSPGTYWYHVHLHGLTESQVMGGLSGLLVVEGLQRVLPRPLRGIEQRQLAIRDLQESDGAVVTNDADIDPTKPTTRLVNGLLRPRLTIRSGETQLWRIANIGSDLFYDVSLAGHRLTVVAEDGSPVWSVRHHRHLVLPPGKRFDVLVQGGAPGSYAFKTLRYDEGFQALPTTELARVTVTGPKAQAALPLPRTLRTPAARLDHVRIAKRRRFAFSLDTSDGGFKALINGRQFNPDVTNVAPTLGTVEQWTLTNSSDEDHPFHIHVNDFQVMSVNGKPYHARGLQDVVIIPKNGGRVVIRNPFEDFAGHYVLHCHILGHEDAGMMQTIDVVKPGQRPTPPPHMGMAHEHQHAR
jgi:FtsP/CotA-like multicopper oxidase with cupredoxin domain